jgi:hypothetical protein
MGMIWLFFLVAFWVNLAHIWHLQVVGMVIFWVWFLGDGYLGVIFLVKSNDFFWLSLMNVLVKSSDCFVKFSEQICEIYKLFWWK